MTHEYTVLHGGTVLTMDGALPTDAASRAGHAGVPDAAGRRATAICFADDRILAVGTDHEILPLAGADSRVHDLGGRVVVPGFRDAHAHPLAEGLEALWPALRATPDLPAGLRLLSASATDLEPDAWLEARYDHDHWRTGRHPLRDELDRAVPDRPVLLHHASGHALVANSLALAMAGVGRTDPAGPRAAAARGAGAGADSATTTGGRAWEIDRDADGEPTGLVRGPSAIDVFADALPEVTLRHAGRALATIGGRLAADGVTWVGDADLGVVCGIERELAAYGAAVVARDFRQGLDLLPGLRHLAPGGGPPPPPAALADGLSAAARDAVTMRTIKVYADGALTVRTAWLSEPYADEPGSVGSAALPAGELAACLAAAVEAGWTVATHAIGDAAIAAVLAGLRAAAGGHDRTGQVRHAMPARTGRHRIEHAMLPSSDMLGEARRLGVGFVVQPEFTAWAGPIYQARLGARRASSLLPYRAMLDTGIPLAFSSDRPVVPGSPIAGIAAAIVHARGALSAAEAVHAWTAGSASLTGDADEVGILSVGRRADLVVLDADPTRLPHDAWADSSAPVRVVATVVGGRTAWGALPGS